MNNELGRLKELAGIQPTSRSVKNRRKREKFADITFVVFYLVYVLFLTIVSAPIILLASMGREDNFFQRRCDDIFRHVLP